MAVMAYADFNAALGATLGVGATGNGYLVDGQLRREAEALGQSSGMYLTLTAASAALPCNVVALLAHNLCDAPAPVVAQVQAADDAGFTVNVVTAMASRTLSEAGGHRRASHALPLNATYTKAYYRVRLFWAGGGTHAVRMGEAFLGLATALPRGLSLGTTEALRFPRRTARGGLGDTWVAALTTRPQRSWEVKVDDASDADVAALRALFRRGLGGARPVLWMPDWAPAEFRGGNQYDCLYGRLSGDFEVRDGLGASDVAPLRVEGLLEAPV